jgi:glutamate N-acetyltransferase / amino-acid N-acetyltransferase
MTDWQEIPGGVTAPKGYKAAGITAGLKASGSPDLALIVSDVEAIAAGVFTMSHVRAAVVDYCRDKLRTKPSARAVMCNSGQANASTGAEGLAIAVDSAESLAAHLGISADAVLLASTGVIGQQVKIDILKAGLPDLIADLTDTGSDRAAKAICTTDTVPKTIALELMIGDRPVRVGGICKGAGMIHPNMATMLGFVTCDAAVAPQLWQTMLSRAVDQSFNQITVDGDTSTNDTVIALANGESRTPAITEPGAEADQLEAMLTAVCIHLAKAIARDGEGATCLIEVHVAGATDQTAARQIARTISGSSLVKSAIFGRDPNWGRIAAAAGRAGVPFDQDDLQIKLGDILMMQNGQPQAFDRAAANAYLTQAAQGAYLKNDTVLISLSVGSGSGSGTAWGCDLSYDYVKINAEYTT